MIPAAGGSLCGGEARLEFREFAIAAVIAGPGDELFRDGGLARGGFRFVADAGRHVEREAGALNRSVRWSRISSPAMSSTSARSAR